MYHSTYCIYHIYAKLYTHTHAHTHKIPIFIYLTSSLAIPQWMDIFCQILNSTIRGRCDSASAVL